MRLSLFRKEGMDTHPSPFYIKSSIDSTFERIKRAFAVYFSKAKVWKQMSQVYKLGWSVWIKTLVNLRKVHMVHTTFKECNNRTAALETALN